MGRIPSGLSPSNFDASFPLIKSYSQNLKPLFCKWFTQIIEFKDQFLILCNPEITMCSL